MSRAVQELTQIPFAYLIGAPLKAAIEAQALAAQSTIEFIHKVGFKQDLGTEGDLVFADTATDADAGEIRNVTFKYRKKDADDVEKTFELSVPLLSIAPIPYLRIDEVTIDFKAKLTDSVERKTNTSFQLQNSVSGKYSAFWSPIKLDFRVSSTFNTSSSTQASQRREYSMDIHVRAVQDEMPAGLSKVLDILEKSVKETPKP
ncbi:MAG: DUF2589 domain-containing protein [Gemmatimonadaceae bacterium]